MSEIQNAIDTIGFKNLPLVISDEMRAYAKDYFSISDSKILKEIFEIMLCTGWSPLDIVCLCGFVQQIPLTTEELE